MWDRVLAAAEASPVCTEAVARTFVTSMAGFFVAYHALALSVFRGGAKEQLNKRSWILTTLSALCMTLASLPYVYQLLRHGFHWGHVDAYRESLAEPMSIFFVAYLVSDLLWGSVYYRHLINFTSGWVHHSAYVLMVLYWLHRGWSHAFMAAAVMEIPTWVMGIGRMSPKLRSFRAFTTTFLSTRIVFHAALIVSLSTEAGRGIGGESLSWQPFISSICVFPMHVFWAYKLVRSNMRRHKKRLEERAAASCAEAASGVPLRDPAKSEAEREGRARAHRVLAAAVRKLWSTAPEAWRKAYAEELARTRDEKGVEDSELRRSLIARRVLSRHIARGLGKRKDNVPFLQDGPLTIELGQGTVIKIPPEIQLLLLGQKYVVSEYPVEREASGSRRQRIIGQVRRRLEVARRDVVVF